jgi:magnesium-transporting ATPase (P-type)
MGGNGPSARNLLGRKRSAGPQLQFQKDASSGSIIRGGGKSDAVPADQLVATAAEQMDLLQPHSLSAAEVLSFYGVMEEQGLGADEAAARLVRYGPNALVAGAKQSLLSMIAEQFEDRLVQILLAVAVLSGVLSFFEEVRK